MSEETKKPKLEYNEVIVKDELDKFVFDDIHDNSKKLQEISSDEPIDKQIEEINKQVSSDLFSSMFQWKSEIAEDANPTMREVLKTVTKLPEFEEMRDYTKSDDIASALGTSKMFSKVAEQYVLIKEEVEQHEQDKKDAQDQGQPDPDVPGGLQKKMNNMRSQMRSSLKEANKDLKDYDDFCASFGNEDGDLNRGDKQEKLDLYKKFNKNSKLKKISQLLGRLKNFYKSEQAISYTHGNDEIIDIEIGNNIERMIPSEMMKFSKNRLQFLLDYAEGRLMQYKMQGIEFTAKGPIVICVDCSSSMDGGREIWAKAVSMAVTDMAVKQKRDVDVLLYNTRVVKEFKYQYGDANLVKKKMEMLEYGNSGGTSFDKPLERAIEVIMDSKAEKSTDILFVTDGQSRISEETITDIDIMKKDHGLRVVGIVIQSGNTETLEEFCDKIHDVEELSEDSSKEIVKEYL